MQPVNDDMDELYKRAAEEYPLNTNSADWNAVLKKLAAEKSFNRSSKNKNYRHLLWLLLLLPLGLLYRNYISNNNKPAIAASGDHAASISKKDLPAASITKKTEPAISSLQAEDASQTKILPQLNNPLNNSPVVQRKLKGRINTVITANNDRTDIADNSTLNNTTTANDAVKKDGVPGVNKEITQTKIETTPTDKKTSDIIKPAEETAKAPQKKTVKQKERGLYLGVMISPDISTVKFQSVKKTGVSMGIIAGYQVNKKLSIESGIAWAIKNYYSKGEYFSTDRVYSNPNAKIKSVAGVCNMIEVPVMIKYDLTTSFSISGGVSSYFMKKEDYDYIIVYNNGQPYPHSSTYKNSSTDLAAVADFAVGYNRQIKKGVTLRIEPYIKVPLKGVGIGSLPIMSTGLNLGVTKKISR